MKAEPINMDPTFVSTSKHLEMTATIFPVCQCGEPWTAHGTCGGYRPASEVRSFTAAFRSTDWLANLLFGAERLVFSTSRKIEQFLQGLRNARLKGM